METRRTTLKKRKAEENMENQVSQKQMFELCNQEVGPRDIVIGDDQILNTNEDFSINKEIKFMLLFNIASFLLKLKLLSKILTKNKFINRYFTFRFLASVTCLRCCISCGFFSSFFYCRCHKLS